MAKFTYEIKKQIASLSAPSKGWNKELNLISWNGYDPKYDIRDWDSTHTKMGKGVTLSQAELKALYVSLKEIFEESESGEKELEITEEIEPIRKNYNVEEEIQAWKERFPAFLQEIKHTILYLNENGFSEEGQREILIGSFPQDVEEALMNEIENMRMMYSDFYHSFADLLKVLNEDELELFLLLMLNQ